MLCHGDRVLCWRVAYDEAEFRRRCVVTLSNPAPAVWMMRRKGRASRSASGRVQAAEGPQCSGLRDGVWP
ncbi:MAG: hypothetical protein ACLSHC_06800 [Bilophila wadsworthia]